MVATSSLFAIDKLRFSSQIWRYKQIKACPGDQVTQWPSDQVTFFVIAEEVNSFMINWSYSTIVGMSISALINHLNHPLLFIFQSLWPSLRVGVFSNQAQLNRYHCSVDTKNLTHPPMQVILTIKIMAEHLFSEVFHQGISTNLSLCYFTGWFPIRWKFEIIYYQL